MNVVYILMAGLGLLIAAKAQTQSQQSPNTQQLPPRVGRYQLLSGEHYINVKGVGQDDKVILRIDTSTGEVDQWFAGQTKDGKMIDRWIPTGNE